jgi:hypothetical protein
MRAIAERLREEFGQRHAASVAQAFRPMTAYAMNFLAFLLSTV